MRDERRGSAGETKAGMIDLYTWGTPNGHKIHIMLEKTGRFLPKDDEARARVLEWLMFQMGNIGPMFGQCYHFKSSAPERIAYAIDRYTREVGRLYAVMDKRLAKSTYLGGDEFSIADIATWPWTKKPAAYDQDAEDFPHVKKWIKT